MATLKELHSAIKYDKPSNLERFSDSSDESEDDFEMSSDPIKRSKPESVNFIPSQIPLIQDAQIQQQLILRKRDIKGNYKAKFNLEKLMIEHEKKKVYPLLNSCFQIQLDELKGRKQEIHDKLSDLRSEIGKKVQSGDQTEIKTVQAKSHWDFLMKEMIWMSEDFEREHKKKIADSKKQSRMCKKQLQEKKLKKEKELKDMKVELRRKANNMSKQVQLYWKSVEKVVKHNYNILYEKKRQQIRTKKLESFVSKHLKLSVKVAEELNTKSFVEQSMYSKDGQSNEPKGTILKLYDQDQILVEEKQVNGETLQGEKPTKRRKITVMVQKGNDGMYGIDEQYESQQIMHSQVLSQQDGDMGISRTKIAEQTVEMAKSFQPTGFTLSSVHVKTKVPFLLTGTLREYQIIGLDWLHTLHNKRLNGILADEMGLGKTIQTIALLASIACDKGVWGPHLIVVPTTIIINWEMEFKKWCPAFKILTYFGSQKERKMKRHGWSKENSFHVCITSYKLVIQDHFAFRRKKWYYMVLDEAQNIKNFKSQRWQTLLRFNTKRRLLLTGTPLQNDVMELWSLMHFLMPTIFSSQQDFKEWFSNPFSQSINQNQSLNLTVVQRLQSILRPFLLRRMKRDVEKQLPEKIEHVIPCTLSRRQRMLYDEYINNDRTKETLNQTDFFSIMNVLMQLRKVCNHPDLFEPRTIESPFIMQDRLQYSFSSLIFKALQYNPKKDVNMKSLNFVLSEFETLSQTEYHSLQELYPQRPLIQVIEENKNHLGNMRDHLYQTRPLGEGLAMGKKLPINCNLFAKSNTKILQHTLPTVMQYESNIYNEIPSYLNSACLPFAQHYYSVSSFDKIRHSHRQKEYNELSVYTSALNNEEQKSYLLLLAEKLIQWRETDKQNRTNLILRKPVYGEDCRKAVKINLLFNDVFDIKRHKNADRYTKSDENYQNELERAPSAVLNPFASKIQEIDSQNKVENCPILTEEEIEQFNNQNSYVKEVPRSQQLRNKRKKQLLLIQQQQLLAQRQQQMAAQILNIPTRVQYTEKQISLIINMKDAKSNIDSNILNAEEREEEENEQKIIDNPCVEVKVEEIVKERIEMKRVEIRPEEQLPMDQAKQKETEENYESPYQRVYQNASKRYKRDVADTDSKDIDVNMENEEESKQILSQEEVNAQELVLSENAQNEVIEVKEGINDSDMKDTIETYNQFNQDSNKISQENEQDKQYQPDEDFADNEINQDIQERLNEEGNICSITYKNSEFLRDLIVTPLQRAQNMDETIKQFKFIIPKAVAEPVEFIPTSIITQIQKEKAYERFAYQKLMSHRNVNQSLKHSNILFFPHKNLIQYDCGKLQQLAILLKNLHSKGSKVLLFTQMTRVLDILENFLNLHGYTYVRLDGSVKVEMRQKLVDRFNLNKKIFVFISSTRCGGIGINLTGADSVIFYDSDWNPAMDKQAQDRCHRIGQTKTVNIYRLISINTIEENIFKKSLQKRELGGLIIEGNFDMEFFQKVSLKDILDDESLLRPKRKDLMKDENIHFHAGVPSTNYEVEEGEMNVEKQKEIENYRRKFEEALVKIEDKEDVIALQQAKREIDEEFDEDAIQPDGTTRADNSTVDANNLADQEANKGDDGQAQFSDNKTAQSLYKDMKRSEFINWRTHPTLNDVTKISIDWYEKSYNFDHYLDDRSKKDNKFVHPLNEDEGQEDKKQKNEDDDEENEENEDSEFSFSEDEEDIAQKQEWSRKDAELSYFSARNDIQSKYLFL